MTPPVPERRWRRKLLAISLLGVTLTVIVANRSWLPRYQARRDLAAHQLNGARWWLNVAHWAGGDRLETEFLLSRLSRMQEDFEQAEFHLEQARKSGLSTERVQRERTLIRAQSGHLQDTLPVLTDLLESAPRDTPDVFEAFVLGIIKARTSMRTAINLLNEWSADFPQDPRPHFLLSELSLELMDLDVATVELQLVLERDPHHAAGAQRLGELMLQQQDPVKALRLFEVAADSNEDRLPALVQQSRCLRLMGHADQARSVLRTVLQEDPSLPLANLEWAHLEVTEQLFQAAIVRLQAVLVRDPNNDEARYLLATALRSVGRTKEAHQQFERVSESRAALVRARYLIRDLVLTPQNANARSEIGRIYLEYGDSAKAVDWLNSALVFDPLHQPTLRALVKFYESHRDASGQSGRLAEEFRKRLEG